jgi:hypothetical protein
VNLRRACVPPQLDVPARRKAIVQAELRDSRRVQVDAQVAAASVHHLQAPERNHPAVPRPQAKLNLASLSMRVNLRRRVAARSSKSVSPKASANCIPFARALALAQAGRRKPKLCPRRCSANRAP